MRHHSQNRRERKYPSSSLHAQIRQPPIIWNAPFEWCSRFAVGIAVARALVSHLRRLSIGPGSDDVGSCEITKTGLPPREFGFVLWVG
jgi:hypothetical protein